MGAQLNVRLRVTLFLVTVAAVSLAACGGGPSEPSTRQIGFIGGSNSAAPNIVGTWQHLVVFIDEYGMVNNFETLWTFESSGNAIRNDITENLTRGVSDTAITTGLWRTDSSLVVITFLQPAPGQLQMAVLVQGDLMFLGGQEYRRVECCATPK